MQTAAQRQSTRRSLCNLPSASRARTTTAFGGGGFRVGIPDDWEPQGACFEVCAVWTRRQDKAGCAGVGMCMHGTGELAVVGKGERGGEVTRRHAYVGQLAARHLL